MVPAFALLALFLTVKHPNHKLRFLHTGMAGAYVAGAVGYAAALGRLPHSRAVVVGSAAALVLAAAAVLGTGRAVLPTSGHASEMGLSGHGQSLRTLTDAAVPLIREGEPTAVFSNAPSKFWATWMYLEHFANHGLLQVDCRQVGVLESPAPEEFAAWCAVTDCRTAIFLSISPRGGLHEVASPGETNAAVIDLLPQSPFHLTQTVEVPDCGTITVWRR